MKVEWSESVEAMKPRGLTKLIAGSNPVLSNNKLIVERPGRVEKSS